MPDSLHSQVIGAPPIWFNVSTECLTTCDDEWDTAASNASASRPGRQSARQTCDPRARLNLLRQQRAETRAGNASVHLPRMRER